MTPCKPVGREESVSSLILLESYQNFCLVPFQGAPLYFPIVSTEGCKDVQRLRVAPVFVMLFVGNGYVMDGNGSKVLILTLACV